MGLVKRSIQNTKRKFSESLMRMLNGYDNSEIHSFYYTFIEKNIKILKDFKEQNVGRWVVPFEYCENGIFKGKLYLNDEQQDAILDTMIFHLQMCDESYVEELLYGIDGEDYISPLNYKDYIRVRNIVEQNKNCFFKSLSLFFYDLWI